MINEHDVIIANKKINDKIPKGTKGVVLDIFENGKAFLIEFVDNNHNTIGDGMETVSKDDIELLIKVKNK